MNRAFIEIIRTGRRRAASQRCPLLPRPLASGELGNGSLTVIWIDQIKPSGQGDLEIHQLMARRFLIQLLPIGILAGLFFATGSRLGLSASGQLWIYSCTFSVGASIGTAGVQGIAPDQEKKTFLGSTADLVNTAMGCR